MEIETQKLAYGIEEFCTASGMSRTSLYAAIGTGALKTFKNGKRRMISVRAAREFIDGLEAASLAKHAA